MFGLNNRCSEWSNKNVIISNLSKTKPSAPSHTSPSIRGKHFIRIIQDIFFFFYMNFHCFNKVFLLINKPLKKQKKNIPCTIFTLWLPSIIPGKNWIISVKAVNVLCILITNKNNKLQKIFHLKIHIVTHIYIY